MPSDRWVWILRFDESLVTGESPVTGADVGGLARSAHRLGFDNPTCRTVFAEADQIEMSERRHGAALDQAHAGGFCRHSVRQPSLRAGSPRRRPPPESCSPRCTTSWKKSMWKAGAPGSPSQAATAKRTIKQRARPYCCRSSTPIIERVLLRWSMVSARYSRAPVRSVKSRRYCAPRLSAFTASGFSLVSLASWKQIV